MGPHPLTKILKGIPWHVFITGCMPSQAKGIFFSNGAAVVNYWRWKSASLRICSLRSSAAFSSIQQMWSSKELNCSRVSGFWSNSQLHGFLAVAHRSKECACLGWWFQGHCPVWELCSGIERTCLWCSPEQLQSSTVGKHPVWEPVCLPCDGLAPLSTHHRHLCHQVASSIAIVLTKAGLHNMSFACGCALIKLQSFGSARARPGLGQRCWAFLLLGNLFLSEPFLLKAFLADLWVVLQEIGTHLVAFFGLHLQLLQLPPELFKPKAFACPQKWGVLAHVRASHIRAIFDVDVQLGYEIDLLRGQHGITHDLPGWVPQNVELAATLLQPLHLLIFRKECWPFFTKDENIASLKECCSEFNVLRNCSSSHSSHGRVRNSRQSLPPLCGRPCLRNSLQKAWQGLGHLWNQVDVL